LRLLILVAREGFLKDKCSPRAKKFEPHCFKPWVGNLFTITGRMNCGISLAGRKNLLILS